MKLGVLLDGLRAVAPEHLAESWDKVGLQVGDPNWAARGKVLGLLCIDLTEAVLAEAVACGAGLVVAYHPVIFEPVTALTTGTARERVLLEAARRRIAIYSPHTALDAVKGGVNDWLVDQIFGEVASKRTAIQSTAFPEGPGVQGLCKVVTFVPAKAADGLRSAMASAGAGVIGHYTQCSFSQGGEGTFLGDAQTRPAVGKRGRLERVTELRLEMVCARGNVDAVVAALRATHPYEEPAVDVYRLETLRDEAARQEGQGRVVRLTRGMSAQELVQRVKGALGLKAVTVALAAQSRKIVTVGICAGAGGSLLKAAGRVDAFITGEMRHHDMLAATQRGITVVLPGHTETERPYLQEYQRRLALATGTARSAWRVSRADRSVMRVG